MSDLQYPSLRKTVAKCSLAAFASLCSIQPMVHAFGDGARAADQAEADHPGLRDTPATLESTARAGDYADRVSMPNWRGVGGSSKFSEIRSMGTTAEISSRSPWLMKEFGAVGKPVEFTVRALASDQPAHSVDRTPIGKMRNWELVRGSNFAPTQETLVSVSGSSRSPVSATRLPDGSIRVKVPAVAGEAQVAWAYPMRAEKRPDGSWSVALGVGAASQGEIAAYQSEMDHSEWKIFQGVFWLAVAVGSAFFGFSALSDRKHGVHPDGRRGGDLINADLFDMMFEEKLLRHAAAGGSAQPAAAADAAPKARSRGPR